MRKEVFRKILNCLLLIYVINIFFVLLGKKVDKNFSVFLKRKKKAIEKMRLYFILAFICKTFMVWPGANNQLDYSTHSAI